MALASRDTLTVNGAAGADRHSEPMLITNTEGAKPDADRSGAKLQIPSVRRSLLLSFVDKHLRAGFQIAAALILARLLTPSQYGVYTIGLVIVYIVNTLRDFGIVTFLIQEKYLTPAIVRTAYGISLLIGCCLAAAVMLVSAPLARFYHSAGVRDVLIVLSLLFLLTPFSSIVAALLRREMRFGTLLRINAAASLTNNSVAVVLAVLGFGFMSLAWGQVAGAAVNFIISSVVRPPDVSHRPSFSQWRRVTSFGVVMVGATLVGDLGARAPDLLIGRFLGITSVGLFGRGVSVLRLFDLAVTNTVTPVATSSFAMRHRAGNSFAQDFLAGLTMVTSVAWPFFAFMALMAYPATRILFGSQWDAAVPITRLLCVAGAITACANLASISLQATGSARRQLTSQWIIQSVSIGLLLLACQYNLRVIGFAMIAAAFVNVTVSFHFSMPVVGVSLRRVLAAMRKSLGVTAGSSVAPIFVLLLMQIDANHIWLPFGIASLGAATGFAASARLVQHPMWGEILGVLAAARSGCVRITSGRSA